MRKSALVAVWNRIPCPKTSGHLWENFFFLKKNSAVVNLTVFGHFFSLKKIHHFPMKNTRSYSLNETHILHWCLELSRASCEIHRKTKVVPSIVEDSQMSKVVPRIVGRFRIDPDRPHGPEFESERVGDVMLRTRYSRLVRRVNVWARDCTSCIAIQVFVRTERLWIG